MDELESILLDLLHANEVRQTVHIRPSLFVTGEGSLQARGPVSLGVVIVPGDMVISKEDGAGKPFRLAISSWLRIDDNTISPRIKCAANYQNGRMALLQAQEDGYDGVLMLDGTGHITEEPRACLFMVRGGVPITPPVTGDILESITRETIIRLFREEHGLEVQEREVDRTEVYIADELFLCGSGMEIQPVGGVDRFSIGNGRPGPVTTAIRKTYMAIVSGDSNLHPEWRTPVYA